MNPIVFTDEYVDVTPLGSTDPVLVLARTAGAMYLAQAKAAYVAGRIDADELERRVNDALRLDIEAGHPIRPTAQRFTCTCGQDMTDTARRAMTHNDDFHDTVILTCPACRQTRRYSASREA